MREYTDMDGNPINIPEYTEDELKKLPQGKPYTFVCVAPGIYQSVEDYEANMRFDEARDEQLLDDMLKSDNNNPVY